MTDRLEEYRRKRDAQRTPEPLPPGRPAPSDSQRFVIQQHHARSLHWDVRLERDGVLVSFAVPRGLPRDRERNHLAKHTEDHSSVTKLPTYGETSYRRDRRNVRAHL